LAFLFGVTYAAFSERSIGIRIGNPTGQVNDNQWLAECVTLNFTLKLPRQGARGGGLNLAGNIQHSTFNAQHPMNCWLFR